MKKPEPCYPHPKSYDYHDCAAWIEQQYHVDLRDYAGTFDHTPDAPYQDFWRWLLDHNEIHNGCYLGIDLDDWKNDEETPLWVQSILVLFLEAFLPNDNEDYLFWISW